ncbi:unnamed protein product [Leptosia nina]|uniref:Uncharacterized protein n=1 Tax=Leptosia nina TaxID=320188 RepID=A0AAV1J7K0_9NEOP
MRTIFVFLLCFSLTYCAIIKRETKEDGDNTQGEKDDLNGEAENRDNKDDRSAANEEKNAEEQEGDEDSDKVGYGGDKDDNEEDGMGNEEDRSVKRPESANNVQVGTEEKDKQKDCSRGKRVVDGVPNYVFIPVPIEIIDTELVPVETYDVYG